MDFINSCKFSAEICVVGVQTTNPHPNGGGGRKTAPSRDLRSERSDTGWKIGGVYVHAGLEQSRVLWYSLWNCVLHSDENLTGPA